MADLVFNIAKGRVVELFNRVDANDPANSAIRGVPGGGVRFGYGRARRSYRG